MKIISIEKTTSEPVFDVTVEGNHYVLSNGIITHNSGGGGLKYAASIILFLSKSKKKDVENHVTGALIKVKVDKSRFTREGKEVTTLFDHTKGLDRYYGLLTIAEQLGIVKKVSTKYQFPDGRTAFESVVNRDPEKWFTADLLKQIDDQVGSIFKYGAGEDIPVEEETND